MEEIRYAHEKDIAATSKCTSLLLLTYALHVDQVMFGSNFWSNPAKLATLTKDAKLAEPAGKQLDEPVDSRVIIRSKTRMWANAQHDGQPAEYRWRPLFNATVWLMPNTGVPCSNAAKMRNANYRINLSR